MTCFSGEAGNWPLICGGSSKAVRSSGLPSSAPSFSTSEASIRTSPAAVGQRPAISSPAQTSSRDQNLMTPVSAL